MKNAIIQEGSFKSRLIKKRSLTVVLAIRIHKENKVILCKIRKSMRISEEAKYLRLFYI